MDNTLDLKISLGILSINNGRTRGSKYNLVSPEEIRRKTGSADKYRSLYSYMAANNVLAKSKRRNG